MFDGFEILDKPQFTAFMEEMFFVDRTNTKQALRKKIASTILLTQYILEPFEKSENHLSIIEGWTILCSYVFGLAEKYNLDEKMYNQSFVIILDKINYQLEVLKKEFFSRKNYLEGFYDGGLFYKARVTLVLGWLSAFELYKKNLQIDYQIDSRVYESIKKFYGSITWYWGESATPLFFVMSKLAQQYGDNFLSNKIIIYMIIDIVFKNRNGFQNQNDCLPDPYYSHKDVLNHYYGPSEQKIDMGSFSGSSYHLGALVDVLVRRKRRDLLNEVWKLVSHIFVSEVRDYELWETFRWRCKSGEQFDSFYNNPQSWQPLEISACTIDEQTLPKNLRANPFSYYFLNCYPHRLNKVTTKLIDLLGKDNLLFRESKADKKLP